jgi:hypothetical protein
MPNQYNPGVYGVGVGAGITGTYVSGTTSNPGTTGTYVSGTTSNPGIIVSPAITYPSITWSYSPKPYPAYVLFKLPINKIPDMVFLNGKALTVGIFGSKAQCAFGLKDLIFAGALFAPLDCLRYTLILQYKTKTYHYCAELDQTKSYVALIEGTNIIQAECLSEIKRI